MIYYAIGMENLIIFRSYFIEKRYTHSTLCNFLYRLLLLFVPYPFSFVVSFVFKLCNFMIFVITYDIRDYFSFGNLWYFMPIFQL